MTRFPAFVTALGVHTAVFVTLIVLPVFTPEPLPEPDAAPSLLPPWPLHPRIALADGPKPTTPARAATAKRRLASAPPLDNGAKAAPVLNPDGPPSDHVADVPIEMASLGSSPDGDGSRTCCGPASGLQGEPAGPGSGLGEGPLRIGGDVRPPTKVHHVAPRYPELAIRARISGTVEIDCLIDETGRVTAVRVLSGHPLLAPAAAFAVRQWAYSPTRLNGTAVPILMSVSVRFELRS